MISVIDYNPGHSWRILQSIPPSEYSSIQIRSIDRERERDRETERQREREREQNRKHHLILETCILSTQMLYLYFNCPFDCVQDHISIVFHVKFHQFCESVKFCSVITSIHCGKCIFRIFKYVVISKFNLLCCFPFNALKTNRMK